MTTAARLLATTTSLQASSNDDILDRIGITGDNFWTGTNRRLE